MENTVNIQIKLDDAEMASFVQKGLNGLSDEKIAEVLLKGFENYLTTSAGEKLFYKTGSGVYDYGVHSPSALTQDLIRKTLDGSAMVQDRITSLAQTVADYIDKHKEDLIRKYMIEVFTSQLFSSDDRYRFEHVCDRVFNG